MSDEKENPDLAQALMAASKHFGAWKIARDANLFAGNDSGDGP